MLNMLKNIDGKLMEKLVPIAEKIGILNLLLILSASATLLTVILSVFVL